MIGYLVLAILTAILVILMILLVFFWDEAKGYRDVLVFAGVIFAMMSISLWCLYGRERRGTERIIKNIGTYQVDTIVINKHINNIETNDTTYNIKYYTKKQLKY